MIARPVSRPHTCLRCQRRLIKGHAIQQLQIAFKSTDNSPKRSPALDSPANTRPQREHPPQFRQSSIPASDSTHPDSKRNVVRDPSSREDSGEFYGFRGRQLLKQTKSLKANRFGDPAEIIVLQESRISRYDYSARKPFRSEPAKVDILARLNDERGLVSEEEVEANINAFRPTSDQEPKNWDEFNDLVRRLQEAFTIPQLEKYIGSFEERRTGGLSTTSRTELPSTDDNTLILQRSPWVPDFAHSSDYFDEDASLRGYALASHTSKQRVVVRLLRQCWELELPELAESMGQAEIGLRPGDLDLLSKGSILDMIKRSVLAGTGEKLEVFPLHGIIRIIATAEKSDLVISEIERVLKSIKRVQVSLVALMPPPMAGKSTKTLEVRKWLDSTFDDTTLAKLGHISNTNITRLPSVWSHGKTDFPISISCLTTPNDTWRSNQANIAHRLLLTSDDFSNRHSYQLACKKMPETRTGTFVKCSSTESLHWREKLYNWMRWTVPIPRQPDSRDSEDRVPDQLDGGISSIDIASKTHEMPTVDLASPIDSSAEIKSSFGMEKRPNASKYWSDTYEIESSAIFGSILHSHRGSAPENVLDPPWGINNTTHTFSPALPTVSPILQQSQLPHLRTEYLTLRFQPNPFYVDPQTNNAIGAGALSTFPQLEMHFDVSSDDAQLRLRTIDAVVEESATDLMLPDYPVDVRFRQKTTSRLQSCWLDLPEIQEFLKYSNLTKDGRRIDLPPTMNMRIATHLCRDWGLKALGRDTNAEMHEVEYLFVGRETGSTLELEFQDWKLQYTSIDQGPAEGKRSELRLRPIKIGADRTHGSYLKTVLNLADAFGADSMFSTRRVLQKDDLTRMSVVTNEQNVDSEGILFTDFAKINRLHDDTTMTNAPTADGPESHDGLEHIVDLEINEPLPRQPSVEGTVVSSDEGEGGDAQTSDKEHK